jgi:hypothetical protein
MISIPEELNPNQGIPGWLELDDLSLHGDMVARRSVESCNKTLQCLGFTQVKSLVY